MNRPQGWQQLAQRRRPRPGQHPKQAVLQAIVPDKVSVRQARVQVARDRAGERRRRLRSQSRPPRVLIARLPVAQRAINVASAGRPSIRRHPAPLSVHGSVQQAPVDI